jgi:amino acid adenylation domain-containing protein
MEIHIFDRMDQGPIDVRMDFNLSRYSRIQAEGHLQRYIQLLKKLPDLAKSPVAMVSTLLDQEKKDLLDVARGPELHYETPDLTIPALFAKSVRLYPDNPAILYEANGEVQSISYAELDQRSNRMARFLISQKIGPERIVGILLPRSPDLLVCILATLKAGAAYLPIDPDYPADRIEHMLRDSGAQYVISASLIYQSLLKGLDLSLPKFISIDDATFQATLLSDFSETGISDQERITPLLPKNLAYIIYTSGSTGKPKGVSVPHAGVINTAKAKVDALKILAQSRVMQFASHAFDGSVQEIFSTFSAGATLVLPTGSIQMNTVANLEEFLRKFSVTHLTLPPALVKVLPDKALEQLNTLLLAGEECTPDLVRRLASHVRMLNGYGPTEVTVCATMSQALNPTVDGIDELGTVSIGRPIANVSSYVLDQYLELTPSGNVGELYITGIGVTRGYLNKPGLTAERFIACPFGEPGGRMYRTGDLVRRRINRDLEYVGRVDHQVKVRGFRIELGEIEAQILKNYPQITQTIVILYKQIDDAFLVAYLVADAVGVTTLPFPDSEQLRKTLANLLPEYMIPAHFQYIDSMPLTVHGKVDRKALPAPQLGGEIKNDFEAPINETEKILCRLFRELIGIENVGVNDDFFHIGGHSLLAIKLIARFKDETGTNIPLDQLFEHATPKILASLIEPRAMESAEPPLIKGMGRV